MLWALRVLSGVAGRQTVDIIDASRFDEIAPIYDETRGGEARGDEYAADIDWLLPREPGTLLEIGVAQVWCLSDCATGDGR